MIKNVVFDFGQVVVRFEPSYMVGKYVSDADDARLLETVIFDRLYWDKLDAGSITDDQVMAACRERLPERLHGVTEDIYYNWIYNIPEIEGTVAIIKDIRATGKCGLYLLSNISTYFAEHADEVEVLENFDKCIFSAVCGRVKPNSDIFDYLCRECRILPEETVFIDDNPANIAGARACGIKAYLFDGNVSDLRQYFESIDVL